MAIETITLYVAKCDRCGDMNQDDTYTGSANRPDAVEDAVEHGWTVFEDDQDQPVLCSDCLADDTAPPEPVDPLQLRLGGI